MNKLHSKFILGVLLVLTCVSAYAQDMPNLIPPSPESSSIIKYTNTNVNLYTGTPSLSIPIYTASFRNASIPISLNYTGFGGIKVEEVAPWVGLGWTLNAGGVVSRTVKGKPDETYAVGYLSLPEPPISETIPEELEKIANSVHDGEPDQFYFNVNGMSGSFFFDRSGNVIQKVESNIEITSTLSGNVITQFTLTDTNGFKYIFAEAEQMKSKTWGASHYSDYFTSSWYLSSIENPYEEELITLSYYDNWMDLEYVTVSALNVQESDLIWDPSQLNYTTNKIKSKRIKSISFDHGSVHFVASSQTRQDYLNDHYLDKIEIRDSENQVFKIFKFDYSYFDNNSISGIGVNPSGVLFKGTNVGDFNKRLRLDQIQEWNGDETESIPPYKFNYDQTQYLPSRYSFALDHWGYYNGQNNNTFFEPTHKVKWFVLSDIHYDVYGYGDREPDATFAVAGVLNSIQYPTGGSTNYFFEQNEVVNDLLPNQVTDSSAYFNVDGLWNTFSVDLINEPFSIIKLWGGNDMECSMRYEIKQGSEVILNTLVPWSDLSLPSNKTETQLESGTYELRITLGSCNLSGSANTSFQLTKEVETAITNKPVGGLRIKSITEEDGLGSSGSQITRNYFYNEDSENVNSNSSGRVLSVPKYGFILAQTVGSVTTPTGRARTIRSTIPLLTTNGSEVGYGRVTVKISNGNETGKTEYVYTTPENYPDFVDAFFFNPLNGEGYLTGVLNVGTLETYPFVPSDNRDVWRGRLVEQIEYKYANNHYSKVKSLKNTYGATFNSPYGNGDLTTPPMPYNSIAANGSNYNYVSGIITHPGKHWIL